MKDKTQVSMRCTNSVYFACKSIWIQWTKWNPMNLNCVHCSAYLIQSNWFGWKRIWHYKVHTIKTARSSHFQRCSKLIGWQHLLHLHSIFVSTKTRTNYYCNKLRTRFFTFQWVFKHYSYWVHITSLCNVTIRGGDGICFTRKFSLRRKTPVKCVPFAYHAQAHNGNLFHFIEKKNAKEMFIKKIVGLHLTMNFISPLTAYFIEHFTKDIIFVTLSKTTLNYKCWEKLH